MDSPLNVYLRCVKSIVEDAERELPERQFHALRAILIIALTAKDRGEAAA